MVITKTFVYKAQINRQQEIFKNICTGGAYRNILFAVHVLKSTTYAVCGLILMFAAKSL